MGFYDPLDQGVGLAGQYLQDAQAKIEQKKVEQKKAYAADYAGKYGLKDVPSLVKGKTDTELYRTAADAVTKRRASLAPKVTQPKPPAQKAAAPKKAAPKKAVTKKASTKRASTKRRVKKPVAKKVTQPRPRTTTSGGKQAPMGYIPTIL